MKLMQVSRCAATFMALSIALPSSDARSQEQVEQQPLYSEIVSRAFEFSKNLPGEFNGIDYRIVLRSMPSSGRPESQVVLLRQSAGPMKVVEYRLKEGSPSISHEYEEVLRKGGKAGVSDVLARVVVEKTPRIASDAIKQLVDEFLKLSIPTQLSSDFCSDGTTYEIWVQTPSNSIHASLSDCAYGRNTSSQPLFHWIRQLQVEIRSH